MLTFSIRNVTLFLDAKRAADYSGRRGIHTLAGSGKRASSGVWERQLTSLGVSSVVLLFKITSFLR